jgi:hypothetical protein
MAGPAPSVIKAKAWGWSTLDHSWSITCCWIFLGGVSIVESDSRPEVGLVWSAWEKTQQPPQFHRKCRTTYSSSDIQWCPPHWLLWKKFIDRISLYVSLIDSISNKILPATQFECLSENLQMDIIYIDFYGKWRGKFTFLYTKARLHSNYKYGVGRETINSLEISVSMIM